MLSIAPGDRFGTLVVLKQVPPVKPKDGPTFLVQCDCGNEKTRRGYNLQNAVSCGCIKGNQNRKGIPRHNLNKSPTYNSWYSMKRRCTYSKDKRFAEYGGRGIRYVERWEFFENFLADMGLRPEGTTLDRIDVNGNYELGNCRWASVQTQERNRRNNVFLTYRGETMLKVEACERFGISRVNLENRLKRGWSVETALETPVERNPAKAKKSR